ncbi:hypothetical protein ACNFBR_27175 [Pseudomonas sp. NY11955]|uniref:hypothetical protein n=1 Tax=Pseudomonas sp. NY11955 TaxID=3400363 RepID=UPI003A83D2B8
MTTQQPDVQQKPLADLIAEALSDPQGRSQSGVILSVVGILIEQTRFDELTEALKAWLPLYKNTRLEQYVIAKVPPKIFNHILKQTGVKETVLMDIWQEHNVNTALKKASVVPGRLAHLVRAYTTLAQSKSQASSDT